MRWFRLDTDFIDWRFVVDYKHDLRVPDIFCPTCQQKSRPIDAARVPEPVVKEVRDLLRPYSQKPPDELEDQWIKAVLSDDPEVKSRAEELRQAIEKDYPTTVQPACFFEIENAIRHIYRMPPSRIIEPGSIVGPKIVSKRFKPRWDVYVKWTDLYFSRRAGDELLEKGFTGIELFPVYTRDGKPSEVYEAVVTGYCGLPKLLSPGGDFFQCEECKRWYLRGDHPLKIGLDPSRWDGSDFFHMEGLRGDVYVSERAYELLNSPFFSTEVWASFHPMEGEWVHPYFDLSGNLFS